MIINDKMIINDNKWIMIDQEKVKVPRTVY